MCSLKAFAICCAFAMCVSKTTSSQNSLDVCIRFNETSGLKELCGYETTVKFLHPSHFENAVKTAKRLIKLLNSCSPYANLIMCSLYIPRCVSNVNGPYLPCRRVFDEFEKQCGAQILQYGLEWILGTCQLLPKQDNPMLGYLDRCFEPPGFTTNLPAEGNSKLKCYPLIVQKCQNIGYNYTIVDTQRQKLSTGIIERDLSQETNESSACSLPRKRFICTEYLPACIDNSMAIYCRNKCEEFFDQKCTPPFSYQKDICMEFPAGNSSVGICKKTQWPRAENWYAPREEPTTHSVATISSRQTTAALPSHDTTDIKQDGKVYSSGSLIIPCWSTGIGVGALAYIFFITLS